MITTLIIQKPVLKASDIFTVGTRLLASVRCCWLTFVAKFLNPNRECVIKSENSQENQFKTNRTTQ